MVYKTLSSTNDFIKMLKRISISKEIILYVKESNKKVWICEFATETLDDLYLFLDLLDYYLEHDFYVRVKVNNVICYTNFLSDVVKNESEEK